MSLRVSSRTHTSGTWDAFGDARAIGLRSDSMHLFPSCCPSGPSALVHGAFSFFIYVAGSMKSLSLAKGKLLLSTTARAAFIFFIFILSGPTKTASPPGLV